MTKKVKSTNEMRLYILMRNDLQSMVPGRCMAQASHAANALIHKHGEHSAVQHWQRQTKQGFGTTIVLGATQKQIDVIFGQIQHWIVKGMVTDPDYCIKVSHEIAGLMYQNYDSDVCQYKFDYTKSNDDEVVISRSEITCAYILGTFEDLNNVLGTLSLY